MGSFPGVTAPEGGAEDKKLQLTAYVPGTFLLVPPLACLRSEGAYLLPLRPEAINNRIRYYYIFPLFY